MSIVHMSVYVFDSNKFSNKIKYVKSQTNLSCWTHYLSTCNNVHKKSSQILRNNPTGGLNVGYMFDWCKCNLG
jgi:hypothetical protein